MQGSEMPLGSEWGSRGMAKYGLFIFCILSIPLSSSFVWAESDESGPSSAASQVVVPDSPKSSEPGKPYTSLIIDVTGFNLNRSMSPKIKQADGTEVWGTVKVDMDFLEDHGIVAYAKSIEDARKSDRCGSNPLIIKALNVDGKADSDPVIAPEDAKLLIEENARGKFLDKFDVIFIQCAQKSDMQSALK
jgi:hypothetical protein